MARAVSSLNVRTAAAVPAGSNRLWRRGFQIWAFALGYLLLWAKEEGRESVELEGVIQTFGGTIQQTVI